MSKDLITNKQLYTYNAELVRVVDGDTIIASVDLGFRTYTTLPLRLMGINAPEPGAPGGREAKEYLESLLTTRRLVVQTHKNPVDKYGRWLAIVWSEKVNANEAMVDDGYARLYL